MTITGSTPITSFTGEYRFLSNFDEHPVTYCGVLFPTAEHAYQYAKCANVTEARGIMHALTPGTAKRLGQNVELLPSWEQQKRRVMLGILMAKFFGDQYLGDALLATGNRDLTEGNTWGDSYWGVCGGVGQNYLGRLLMITRDALRVVTE
jgi:ribA/ribD-fused uncharacterized protein